MTATSDGTLWWADDVNLAIGQMTASGTINEFVVPGLAWLVGYDDAVIPGITVGPDGNVWFTEAEYSVPD